MARYKISTLLRSSKDKHTTIFITVALNGTRVLRYPSGFNIATSHYKTNGKVKWTGLIKSEDSNLDAIQNRKLKERMNSLERYLERQEEEHGKFPLVAEIQTKLDELSGKKKKPSKTIWDELDKYSVAFKYGQTGTRISINSQNIRKQLKNRLYEFNKNTTFADFNEHYLSGFAEYLAARGLSKHSIALQIGVFKSFIRTLKLQDKSFEDFKYKKAKQTKEQKEKKWSLTWEEIKQLQAIKLPDELDIYRTAFLKLLFSCQRFSDLDKICQDNIKINGGGRKVLIIEQQKTGAVAKVPINEHLENLLEASKGEPIDYQEFLDALKKISAIMFKGEKVMTTHTARRSGASLYYLKMKLPISVVRTLTGHGSEQQFLAYLDPDSVDDTQSILDAFKELD